MTLRKARPETGCPCPAPCLSARYVIIVASITTLLSLSFLCLVFSIQQIRQGISENKRAVPFNLSASTLVLQQPTLGGEKIEHPGMDILLIPRPTIAR